MKQLLFKRKLGFLIYFIACFLPMIVEILRAGVFSLIFNAIEVGKIEYFHKVLLISIGFLVYNFISYISSRFMRISYMRDTILDLRISAFNKIINMNYKQFNNNSKEVYISNLINDIKDFENNFFVNLMNFIFSTSTYIVSGIIIFLLDYRLGIIIVGSSIVIFLIAKTMEKKTTSLHEDVSINNVHYTTNLSNLLNGLEIVKLNNIESKFLYNSLNVIKKTEKSKYKFRAFKDFQMGLVWTLGSFVLIGSLLFLMTQINSGARIKDMAMIVILSSNMTFRLRNILPRINVIKSSAAIYNRITTNIEEQYENNKVNQFSFNREIVVRDLSFSFNEKVIFNKANFVIKKNHKYLIKGASGAGKSTLIKILTNVYDNYQGLITVDGVDLKTITDKSFSKEVAFIYQDVFLFEDTLKNNITLYKDIDINIINDAIERSGLSEFVIDRPKNIDQMIKENGKNLSGGQRQRISIARAIAKGAGILFVDEGTSSLNMELGRQIEESFINFTGTVLSISHRYYDGVSNKYNYVLELKNGKINTYQASEYFQEDPLDV